MRGLQRKKTMWEYGGADGEAPVKEERAEEIKERGEGALRVRILKRIGKKMRRG
jgi:hypothetical protein